MEAIQYIALSMGVAWASGINLYAAVFMLGYLGATGNITLPPDLLVVNRPAGYDHSRLDVLCRVLC